MAESSGYPALVAASDSVSAAFQKLVAGVRDDQWSRPTPCTEWDVRSLVNHVAGGNLRFAAMISGAEPPERSADHLGGDPEAGYAASRRTLHDAFSAPGVAEGTFASPLGPRPGPALVQMRITEHLVHGWDLARATGQSMDVPDALVEKTLAGLKPQLAGMPRPAGGMFAEEVAVADGAPPLDRLAGFLGRAV